MVAYDTLQLAPYGSEIFNSETQLDSEKETIMNSDFNSDSERHLIGNPIWIPKNSDIFSR